MARSPGPRVWSIRRKLLANTLPLACGAPFLILAAWLWFSGLGWDAVGAAAASLVVPAISLNWFGLAGNRAMRNELERRLKPGRDAIFVGFSRPDYFDILDPHEELGFLSIEKDGIRIVGELREVRIEKE
ncbi:MAG TPA: hypothetical protein VKT78_18560, partial [Fimbriimonadaceae bacterium]|nr:hypothetical protein [Fimbriimonadaceae bacterium]